MLTKENINFLLDINEGYELPGRMMEILRDREKREETFKNFLFYENDLSFDWFTDYYQEEHSDRKELKQDFTPDCICELMSSISTGYDAMADICAGTGGLTIKNWNRNKEAFYYCEEISTRAIPVLLFNLAIRNIKGQVVECDSLRNDIRNVYTLRRGERFSEISFDGEQTELKFGAVIMNPPYSLGWEAGSQYEHDARFEPFGVPPKSKADWGFVLHGISKMVQGGTLLAVLPHGVLFRGGSEGTIREKLIRAGLLDTVIGLPDKLFLNTGIPVLILVIRQHRDGSLLIIDAKEQYQKGGKQNFMLPEHIEKISGAYKIRANIEKLSHVADMKELEDNGFNLNIPRYVDTFERPEPPDLCETIESLVDLDQEIRATEASLLGMMKEMTGTNEGSEVLIRNAIEKYERYLITPLDKPHA